MTFNKIIYIAVMKISAIYIKYGIIFIVQDHSSSMLQQAGYFQSKNVSLNNPHLCRVKKNAC